MDKIDPAMGIIGNKSLIYILRFNSDSALDPLGFCESIQDVLYDDIGSVGHFRLAPSTREDLNENYILLAKSRQPDPFIKHRDDELYVSFFVQENCEDTPLSEELCIIPKELKDFCEATHTSVEQIDVRLLYS